MVKAFTDWKEWSLKDLRQYLREIKIDVVRAKNPLTRERLTREIEEIQQILPQRRNKHDRT